MVIFKLLYLSYMPTTLFFSYYHINSLTMLYPLHKYKKKFESTNMDLTHSKIMIFFLAFLVRGYGYNYESLNFSTSQATINQSTSD